LESSEIPNTVAVQEEDADAAQNGGPTKTPVVVQEAPKQSYASILKKNAAQQPTVAIKKPPLVRTITRTSAQPNSAQLSPNSNSTPVNMPVNYSTADGNGKCSIFINNLSVNITPPQVEEELEKFGALKPCGVQVRSTLFWFCRICRSSFSPNSPTVFPYSNSRM